MANLKSESSGSSGQFTAGSYTFVEDTEWWCKCDSPNIESVPDAKSCLKHHSPGKCYSYGQFNLLDEDLKFLSATYVDGKVKSSTENQLIEEYYPCYSQNDAALSSDTLLKHLFSDAKSLKDIQLQEFESTTFDELRNIPMRKEIEHFWLSRDSDHSNNLDFEQPNKLSSDLDSHLIGLKQIEPWWHAADTDDLAILASQKPSQCVRNCDLPEAHTMHSVKSSGDYINCSEQIKEGNANKEAKLSHVVNCTQANFASVKETKSPYVTEYTRGNITSKRKDSSLGESGLIECMVQGDGTLSSDDSSKAKLGSLDTHELVSDNLSRVELLEALCHSQTRAREAEKLAQTAYDEKEHVVDLFFRQASYLFAYRQWLRMLQLETLCLQLNSSTTSSVLPWIRSKGIVLRKKRRGTAKKKPGKHGCHVCKYAIAFALGLGLAGAGLLVGWTIGWLFPTK